MKTPEEIKKGLECCGNDMFLCPDECPYIGSAREGSGCAVNMSKDALAYIRQIERDRNWLSENYDLIREVNKRLEAQNAELVRKTDKLQSSMDQVQKALQGNGFGSLEELLQAYSQAKRERDAAVRDLKSVQGGQRCERCKNYGGTEFIDAVCIECINGSVFEWRGVPELPQEE